MRKKVISEKLLRFFWLFSAIFGSLKSFYLATMILDHLKIAKQPISVKKMIKKYGLEAEK